MSKGLVQQMQPKKLLTQEEVFALEDGTPILVKWATALKEYEYTKQSDTSGHYAAMNGKFIAYLGAVGLTANFTQVWLSERKRKR